MISRRKRYPRNLCSPARSGSCRRERSTRACITEERKEKQRRRRHNRRPINSVVGGLPSLLANRNNNRGRGGSAWQPPSACRGVRARRRDEKLHHTPSTTRQSLTGLSLGEGGAQVRSTDTTLHQAAGIVIYMRDTCNALCDFFSLFLSLARVFLLSSSPSLHGLTIVSRDRVRTTLRRNGSSNDDDDNDYVLFRNLFLCLATLFFLPFVRCHCHRFRRRRRRRRREPRSLLSCARAEITRRVK